MKKVFQENKIEMVSSSSSHSGEGLVRRKKEEGLPGHAAQCAYLQLGCAYVSISTVSGGSGFVVVNNLEVSSFPSLKCLRFLKRENCYRNSTKDHSSSKCAMAHFGNLKVL